MKQQTDFLIVGQGLAGSLLAGQLIRSGKTVVIIDTHSGRSASGVAAGLIHPVTGRRIVKTWMADTLFPFAAEYYKALEKESGRKFFYPMQVAEIVCDVRTLNDWMSRSADPGISMYISGIDGGSEYAGALKPFRKIIRTTSSGWLDIPGVVEYFSQEFRSSGILRQEAFRHDELKTGDRFTYGNISADKIIFCEGSAVLSNPFFKFIPMEPAKGQIITIHCPGLPEEHIILSGIFLIPLGNSLFRVGATFEWNFSDDMPDEDGRKELILKLDELLKLPYEMKSHRAAIRPTMRDRRPVIGRHPEHKDMFIFNGLGTKGALLAPYFSSQLTQHLIAGTEITDEVNVARFFS